MAPKFFTEQEIVFPPAVGGIANQVVADVFHVSSQLVAPSGFGVECQQAVTRSRIRMNGEGNLNLGDSLVPCHCHSGN